MILVIGVGSIGKRHINNLIHLGKKNIVLVSRSGKVDENLRHLPCYSNIQTALLNHKIKYAFICTPTSSHISDLNILLDNNIKNIYLEKPISNSFEGLDLLSNKLIKTKRIVVGFDLRYDPGINKVRQLISENIIGNILSVNAFVGQYLPDWRPYEDHRKGSSASIEKGGGVLLDLIHEFDYLSWIVGIPRELIGLIQHNTCLGIETEDLADVLIAFENNCNATIHLDYHQRKLVRNCLITGTKGTIKWDLSSNLVEWVDDNLNSSKFCYKGFNRNDRYISIVKAFLNEEEFDFRLVNFNDALLSLKMVLAVKKSVYSKSFVHLSEII